MAEIIEPAVRGLAEEGRRYVGVLYAGLMLTSSGPKVLEFNARLGDPETQAVLPMMESDLVDIIEAAVEGDAFGSGRASVAVRWREGASVCLVVASEGYPAQPAVGDRIYMDEEAARAEGLLLFHAGTKYDADGRLVSSGGRVMNVVATAGTVREASARAYEGVRHVKFRGMWYRRDIGLA